MKIRTDFVTNSSSSSFIIVGFETGDMSMVELMMMNQGWTKEEMIDEARKNSEEWGMHWDDEDIEESLDDFACELFEEYSGAYYMPQSNGEHYGIIGENVYSSYSGSFKEISLMKLVRIKAEMELKHPDKKIKVYYGEDGY